MVLRLMLSTLPGWLGRKQRRQGIVSSLTRRWRIDLVDRSLYGETWRASRSRDFEMRVEFVYFSLMAHGVTWSIERRPGGSQCHRLSAERAPLAPMETVAAQRKVNLIGDKT